MQFNVVLDLRYFKQPQREAFGFFYLKSNVFSSITQQSFTDLFILYFFIQNVYANKKVFKIKGYKIM